LLSLFYPFILLDFQRPQVVNTNEKAEDKSKLGKWQLDLVESYETLPDKTMSDRIYILDNVYMYIF